MSKDGPRRLSKWRIIEMNLGFFGLQFSFGLQQSNMGPIYSFLGASEAVMPLLWLAGPVTGLIVQPIVGLASDRTATRWGRRTPYMMIGALLCSIGLLLMPHSSSLWMAASLLWVLDAANNVTMEPYRAYVVDRLNQDQQSWGFLTQSAFTGLAQTISYLTPSILVWWGFSRDVLDINGIPEITRLAFEIGAAVSLGAIAWSLWRVPEGPVYRDPQHRSFSFADGPRAIMLALREAPPILRQLIPSMSLQWYAMFVYWQFITLALSRSLFGTTDPTSPDFREAVLISGQIGAFYNFIAFLAALLMVPSVRRFGAARVHTACLLMSGLSMLTMHLYSDRVMLLLPMIGIGLGWASMMGNTYIIAAESIPKEKTGVYIGLFATLIVIPMLIETLTMPFLYSAVLDHDPRMAIVLAGLMMMLAGLATILVWGRRQRPAAAGPDV